MFRLIMFLLVAVLAWQWLWPAQTIALGPGVMAGETPIQQGIGDREAFMMDDYRVTPLADFSIRAKLLSRKSYFLGQESDLSPVDFALGWGPMSDEEILKDIEINQSGPEVCNFILRQLDICTNNNAITRLGLVSGSTVNRNFSICM